MPNLKRFFLLVVSVAATTLAVWACSGSKNNPQTTTPTDAGPGPGGEVKECDPSVCGIEASALADENRIVMSWVYAGDVDHWKVYWVKKGDSFPGNSTDNLAKDVRQALISTGLEKDVEYNLFVAGFDGNGTILALGASKKVQSTTVSAKTSAPAFRGPSKITKSNDADYPSLLTFNNGNLVLIYRSEGSLKASISKDRGANFNPGPEITKNPVGMSVTSDPETGQALVCYMNSMGSRVAISTNSGESWMESAVWDLPVIDTDAGTVDDDAGTAPPETDMEYQGCGVAILRNGTYLLISNARLADYSYVVRVRHGSPADDGSGTIVWSAPTEFPRGDRGEVAVAVDPVLRGDNKDKEMVYVAFETKGPTGDKDIQFLVSEDGAQNWRTTTTKDAKYGPKAGTVLQIEDSMLRGDDQLYPTLAVDAVTGRLWVAWENKKNGETAIIANNDDQCATSPSGSTKWSVGQPDLGTGALVRSPHIKAENGKLLIAFTATLDITHKDAFRPYLTLFDADAKVGTQIGKFEAPQPGQPTNYLLSADKFIASDAYQGAAIYNGPYLVGDGVISRFAAWVSDKNPQVPNHGDIELLVSP